MVVSSQVTFLPEVLEIVAHSHAAVMVVDAQTSAVVAASPGAHTLLDPIAEPLIGRSLQDFFTVAEDSGAMPLLAAGRITGYEMTQTLRDSGGQSLRLWVRVLPDIDPGRLVLAVLLKDQQTGQDRVPLNEGEALSPLIGSADAGLVVDRVSCEAFGTLGYDPDDIVGMSFLALVAADSRSDVLTALAQMAQHPEGLTVRAGIIAAGAFRIPCQLVLLPLEPAPSFAFALISEDVGQVVLDARAVAELITRLSRGTRGPAAAKAVASAMHRSDVDLGHLSGRELEIVAMLMDGSRVSSIAKMLYLSEGTVRNHLSSAFGKLGVKTQQQLIELLRPPGIDGPAG